MNGGSGIDLRITDIHVSLRDEGKLRAFVTLTLDNCFAIRGMKIIKGTNGMFVAMPSRRRPEGGYQDLVHPINADARRWLEEQILEAYRMELEKNAVVR